MITPGVSRLYLKLQSVCYHSIQSLLPAVRSIRDTFIWLLNEFTCQVMVTIKNLALSISSDFPHNKILKYYIYIYYSRIPSFICVPLWTRTLLQWKFMANFEEPNTVTSLFKPLAPIRDYLDVRVASSQQSTAHCGVISSTYLISFW